MADDKRRRHRVTLLRPLAGQASGKRIFIKDMSLSGLLIAHQERIGLAGDAVEITFEWEGRKARLTCSLRWTHVQRVGRASFTKSLYISGVHIGACSEDTASIVRDIVGEHVSRALDEQKANARGIPPTHVQSVQSGKGSEFVRHEYSGGTWRHAATFQTAQPLNGFTVSSDLSQEEVELLREAWVIADAAIRDVIRKTSELSISNKDGIPIRRYTP